MCLTLTYKQLLEIKDLTVDFDRFGGKARVLNRVNLAVAKGEKVGVVGETGCGKSVTMKAVMNLLPTRRVTVGGSIFYKGRDLLTLDRFARRQITGKEVVMIFQDPMTSLNPVFTIGQQMEDIIGYNLAGAKQGLRLPKRLRQEAREQAARFLAAVKLADPERILNSYPFQLSGGMRQRVLIALALANQPDLIIADEPGTALDVTTQAQILELMDQLVQERGIALLMITHNLGVVRETTDRVYVMYAGTVVETAATDALFAEPLHPYTKGLLDSVPKLHGQGLSAGIEGSVPDYLQMNPGCRFYPRCPQALPKCEFEPPEPRSISENHMVSCHLIG